MCLAHKKLLSTTEVGLIIVSCTNDLSAFEIQEFELF